MAAAGVAEGAAAQGLFWAMHELLFHRQKALGEDDLFAYAREVGLDEERLRDDLERDDLWQRVREDAASALASGARGTPTLFLDGRLHSGGYDGDPARSPRFAGGDRAMSSVAPQRSGSYRFQIKRDRDGRHRWYAFNGYGTMVDRHPEGFATEREARLDAEQPPRANRERADRRRARGRGTRCADGGL